MRKIWIILTILLIGGLVWYLFLKPYDYVVNTSARTFPGAIQQTIQLWNKALDSAEIIEKNGITELTQQITFGDSTHIYKWQITPINDSLSKIKVSARDRDHSINNKIRIPFADTDFEKRTRKTVLDLGERLVDHIKRFKVEVIGKEQLKSTYCACTSLKTTQLGKTRAMREDFPLLDNFFVNNNVKLNGQPFIEVTDWNMQKDSIQFNFCYPILQPEVDLYHPQILYKRLPSQAAIKAVYNGNYTTSDRAWYVLLDYARKNDLEVTGLPVELFYNNPNMGGDELNWKAEIYMPLENAR